MTQRTTRAAWMILLTVVLFVPLVLRFSTKERSSFFLELVDVSGLLAVSALATVLVLTARMKSITRAFGLQVVLSTHKYLGLLAAMLVVLHIIFVVLVNPLNIMLLTPFGPPRSIAGMLGFLSILALVGLTVLTQRRNHDVWLLWHIILAAVLTAATVAHVILLNHLVNDPLEGPFLGGLAGFVLAVLIARWVGIPLSRRGTFVVLGSHEETANVATLRLRPRRKNASPIRFAPGQFAWIRLRRAPISEHPFTISSPAQYGTRPTFTYRRQGDWTEKHLMKLEPGDQVWLDGPHGGMTPEDSVTQLVLIAGGAGISPIISILRTMVVADDERPVQLFLADRSSETLFRSEILQIQEHLNLDVVETHQVRVTAEFLIQSLPESFDRLHADYYICGSPILVHDTTESLAELGVSTARIHTELFDLL